MQKNAVDLIAKILKRNGFNVVREYKFLTNRKFRFDLAIPELKIAIEYEGGIFQRGRHVNPIGYSKDCEKYNLAQIEGWKVLRYTTKIKNKKNWQFIILYDVIRISKKISGGEYVNSNDYNNNAGTDNGRREAGRSPAPLFTNFE